MKNSNNNNNNNNNKNVRKPLKYLNCRNMSMADVIEKPKLVVSGKKNDLNIL